MIAAMKIYTKTGDDGTTGLVGGSRVSKADGRIECYGDADELNAAIGMAIVIAEQSAPDLAAMLREVQDDLFVVGSHLATPENSPHRASLPKLEEGIIARLELQIDAAVALLPALRNFIMPGGTELAARLHLARTICRRPEAGACGGPDGRRVQVLCPYLLRHYFNRLSDWLFITSPPCESTSRG